MCCILFPQNTRFAESHEGDMLYNKRFYTYKMDEQRVNERNWFPQISAI